MSSLKTRIGKDKNAESVLREIFRIHRTGQHRKWRSGCYLCNAEYLFYGDSVLEDAPVTKTRRKRKGGGKRSAWQREMRKQPCHYCGGPGGTVDHKTPLCHGGRSVPENTVPCCHPCNNFKGDRYSYDEFKNGAWKQRPFANWPS